jgi:hypothetical protein
MSHRPSLEFRRASLECALIEFKRKLLSRGLRMFDELIAVVPPRGFGRD